ncbi:MAG TPA: hypothetical protein VII28_17720 [Puia sp.]
MGKYIPHSYSGRADNVVYVHTARGTYMRSRPRKYKRTPATQKAATVFGQAASIGAILRSSLLPGLSLDSYKGFQNRLTVAIASWLRSHLPGEEIKPAGQIPSLLEVEYNEKGRTIDSLWRINRIVRLAEPGVLEMVIPAFNPVRDLSVAPGTANVSFAVSAASVTLGARENGHADFEFSFEYADQQMDERLIRLEFPTPSASLLVTAACLKCRAPRYGNLRQINPAVYGPAAIINAMYL